MGAKRKIKFLERDGMEFGRSSHEKGFQSAKTIKFPLLVLRTSCDFLRLNKVPSLPPRALPFPEFVEQQALYLMHCMCHRTGAVGAGDLGAEAL